MNCLWIKVLGMLVILLVSGKVVSQCSPQSGKRRSLNEGARKIKVFILFSTEMYLMRFNTCYGDNTVFNEEDINGSAETGITCFRKGSLSPTGILKSPNGSVIGNDSSVVQYDIGNGSLTFFTLPDFEPTNNGKYTCCINGSCISARILTNNSYYDFLNSCELLETKYIIQ